MRVFSQVLYVDGARPAGNALPAYCLARTVPFGGAGRIDPRIRRMVVHGRPRPTSACARTDAQAWVGPGWTEAWPLGFRMFERQRYALLCENSFSTGTPTLCRAREAQSRWKNSST